MTSSTPPAPYLHFPGTAREALTFYASVFGGAVQLHTFEDFNRTDGPAEATSPASRSGERALMSASTACSSATS